MTAVERYTNWASAIGERTEYAVLNGREDHALHLAWEAAHCANLAIALAETPVGSAVLGIPDDAR